MSAVHTRRCLMTSMQWSVDFVRSYSALLPTEDQTYVLPAHHVELPVGELECRIVSVGEETHSNDVLKIVR